jgi:uncharacterized membrane protein
VRPALRRHLRRYLRRYLRSLDHVGVIVALGFFILSLTPSLLPRAWPVQGLVSGFTVAAGYGVGVAIAWIARRIGVPQPGDLLRLRAWFVITGLAVVTVPGILWLSSGWQREIRHAVGIHSDSRSLYLGVFVIAAALAAALVGLVRLLRDLYGWIARRLHRFLPALIARIVAVCLVTALAIGIANGVVYDGLIALANSTFSVADNGNYAGVEQPTSPERSGAPDSLVPWHTLGLEGRAFVADGPAATEIAQFTGRPAKVPIRVFAGLDSAATLDDEAHLVLAELRRTGAFDRAVLAVATSTGTGWIDPALADPLEYMFGGDTAIASLQYSFLPSWMSFLVDSGKARQAGRLLFNVVYDYWRQLLPEHRPRLVVFGESLGSYGAAAAFSGPDDLAARTSGALFVGTPNSTQSWRELTDQRKHGSPERLPVYGDGQTVRFAADAKDLREPGGSLSSPTVVYLQHASDPIVWWSTSLLWHKPDWLGESRGPDVIGAMHWYPIVTFWQVTSDLIASTAVPAGHGHNYGPEAITAWQAILHPPGWTDADTAALAQR